MGWFTQNDETEQEEYGELENMSAKLTTIKTTIRIMGLIGIIIIILLFLK